MKRTIDNVLLRAERCIKDFEVFLEECKDSDFVLDSFSYRNLVSYAKQVCDLYYRHWPSEFVGNEWKRYRWIRSYDEVLTHQAYIERAKVTDSKQFNFFTSDLPF